MKLVSLRVRNYKTVVTEAVLELTPEGSVLVGANNSGKSNLLKAINLFFKKDNDQQHYVRDQDFPFNGESSQKTSFIATFSGNVEESASDHEIFADYDRLRGYISGSGERQKDELQLSLQVSPSDRFTYQFFPNQKQRSSVSAERTQFSRLQTSLAEKLLGSFECNYIEAQKDAYTIHERILMPYVKSRAAKILEGHQKELAGLLDEVSTDINSTMSNSRVSNLSASVKLPPAGFLDLLGNFVVEVDDSSNTPLEMKGHGIQSTVLLASLKWVSKQIVLHNKTPIWLIEEPEAFMHPSLAHQSACIIDSLASEAQVVTTTHSMAFVPLSQDRVIGVSRDEISTKTENFGNYHEATRSIRSSLGIKFGDYFNLQAKNIFVEGITDQNYLEWIFDLLSDASDAPESLKDAAIRLLEAQVLEMGGTTGLVGFIRSNYKYIRSEQAVVCLFDGDDAGKKAVRDLNAYLGGRESINFSANEDYILAREGFEIEGLFPDEWIIQKYQESSAWFDEYAVDATGETVSFFKIRDKNKFSYMDFMKRKAEEAVAIGEYGWLSRWSPVLTRLDSSLENKVSRLSTVTDIYN